MIAKDEPLNISILVARVEGRTDDTVSAIRFLAAGGSHRMYVVSMQRIGDCVLRVHYPSGHARSLGLSGLGLTASTKLPSEVATMEFVRAHTTIPVPEIICFEEDPDGASGGAWILMEYVHGEQLSKVMHSFSKDDIHRVASTLAGFQAQLLALRFGSIGSLYKDADNQMFVGPTTFLPSSNFLDKAVPSIDKCGPFNSVQGWLLAVAKGYLDYHRLLGDDERKQREVTVQRLSSELRATSIDPRLATFVLEHVDFLSHNILVDPACLTRILSVIDWEGARIVPLFAVEPRFLRCVGRALGDADVRAFKKCYVDELSRRNPDWADAMGKRGEPLRRLLRLAEVSECDEDLQREVMEDSNWWEEHDKSA